MRLRETQRQRDQLRIEVGYLADGDPDQVAATRVPLDQPMAWKFRVRVPPGEPIRLACGTLWPREQAVPVWNGAQAMPEGESTVLVRIMRDPRDDRWKLSLIVRNATTTLRLSVGLDDRQAAIFRSSFDTLGGGIGGETVFANPGDSLRLLDQRWLSGDGGLLLYGDRPPVSDVDGVFVELQPDVGPLNR
jgi:hypothetical protein